VHECINKNVQYAHGFHSGAHALIFFYFRMARTKLSRTRQIEEESDIGASNLPIGPNHQDDTTNQGSGDAGAPNLPILGPDHEDEDGDNDNHSPSVYLNLNQDDEEDDARNVEHEGDENEEDGGNARSTEHEGDENEQALVGAL
jgi:hypothetical protein